MPDRLPISILLLARDEAARLDALLPQLNFARETVVIVDTATCDDTKTIAERHGARVFERALEDFGAQRRFALEQCREDWVLWLDADERLDARAVAGLAGALAGTAAGYRVARRTWFFGKPIRFCGWQGEQVLRLFRRAAARFDDAPVHEHVAVAGHIDVLPGSIEHFSYERWSDCRDKLVRYAAAGAERARRDGRRATILDFLVRPPLRFVRQYLLQLGFLDGARGAAVCAMAAAQVYLKYADLWARRHERAKPAPDPSAR